MVDADCALPQELSFCTGVDYPTPVDTRTSTPHDAVFASRDRLLKQQLPRALLAVGRSRVVDRLGEEGDGEAVGGGSGSATTWNFDGPAMVDERRCPDVLKALLCARAFPACPHRESLVVDVTGTVPAEDVRELAAPPPTVMLPCESICEAYRVHCGGELPADHLGRPMACASSSEWCTAYDVPSTSAFAAIMYATGMFLLSLFVLSAMVIGRFVTVDAGSSAARVDGALDQRFPMASRQRKADEWEAF